MDTIIIGARGSKLSLIQTDIVKNQLKELFPNIRIIVKSITTTGDKNMQPVPLDSVGKGWFTKELDHALLNKNIDIAVHSLKDLPEELPNGLIIGAVLKREDAREAFVTNKNCTFQALPKTSLIGTDSTRRKATVLHMRQDLRVESVRGNVNTRLEKLDNGQYDALILAVAGLKRLGMEKRITQYFEISQFIPSPGQGALAVVIKKSEKSLVQLIKKLNHQPTIAAVTAEREFSKIIGGGCKMPVGAYAECSGSNLMLYGVIGSTDGKYLLTDTEIGKTSDAVKIGETLAARMLKKSKPWYTKSI